MGLVQGMYATAQSGVCVGEGYSEEFEVKVGVHQGPVLNPLLFIIVLEALSRMFPSGVLWEDLYADVLVIIAESLEECVRNGGERIGSKCRKDEDNDQWYGGDSAGGPGQFPCAICRTGVGSKSVFCNGCKRWVHKNCSGFKHLTKDPD